MKKILFLGTIFFLIASLSMLLLIHAEENISDAFTFTETELEYIYQRKENLIWEYDLISDYEGESMEFGNPFRMYESRGISCLKEFAEGITIRQLLEEAVPQKDIGFSIIIPYTVAGTDWSILVDDPNVTEKVAFVMDDVLGSLESRIIEKFSETDINTLEIKEVLCLNDAHGNYGFYVFIFTNQGNYVFYQNSIVENSKSYFFTEEEFYEFIPTEYEKRNGGVAQESPSLGNEAPTPSIDEPPIGEEPEKFDLRHLYWMIPTAVVIVGGGVGVVYWQVKKRKKIEE